MGLLLQKPERCEKESSGPHPHTPFLGQCPPPRRYMHNYFPLGFVGPKLLDYWALWVGGVDQVFIVQVDMS